MQYLTIFNQYYPIVIAYEDQVDEWYEWDYQDTPGIPTPSFGVNEVHTMYSDADYYFHFPTSHNTISTGGYRNTITSILIEPSGTIGIIDYKITRKSTIPGYVLDTPNNAASGNLLLGIISVTANYVPSGVQFSDPGWTNIDNVSFDWINLTTWYKYLSSPPPSSYSVTALADGKVCGCLIAISGCNYSDPVRDFHSVATWSSNYIPVGLEPLYENSLVLTCAGLYRGTGYSTSGNYDTTLFYDYGGGTADSTSLMVLYQYPEKITGLKPYPIGPDGPYTFYIDPDDINATDIDNFYGTYSKPRLTYPTPVSPYPSFARLTPGTIIEVHGGPLEFDATSTLSGSGTFEQPIFFRSNSSNRHIRRRSLMLNTLSYCIFEDIEFDFQRLNKSAFSTNNFPVDNIVIRNNLIHNLEEVPSEGKGVISLSETNPTSNEKISNIVIMGNHIHHMGEGRTGGKRDITCIYCGPNVGPVWVIGNHIHHIGGDGVQCNCDTGYTSSMKDYPHSIYIGRNTFHSFFENAVDLKVAGDIIISKNTAYNFGTRGETPITEGSPFRFGMADATPSGLFRNNIWTMFNYIYNLDSYSAFSNFEQIIRPNPLLPGDLPSSGIFFIGNVVVNCSGAYNNDLVNDNIGFYSNGQIDINFINNTIYNTENPFQIFGELASNSGILMGRERCTIINNVIGGSIPSGADSRWPYHIYFYGLESSRARATICNNIFHSTNPAIPPSFFVNTGTQHIYSYSELAATYPEWVVGSMNTDPLFVDPVNNDFSLQINSPAIGSGMNVQYIYDRFYDRYGLNIAKNFNGDPLVSGQFNIGAF